MAEQIYTEINKFNTTPKLKKIERFPFLLISFSFSLNSLQHIYNRGGSRGRVQGCVPPPSPFEMTCGCLIKLLFCKKNYVVYCC